MRKCLTAVGLFMMLMLAACGSVENELLDYVNDELHTYYEHEEELNMLLTEYSENMAGADVEEIYETLDMQVEPKIAEIARFVQGIELEHEPIQEVHQLLVDSVQGRHEAIQIELEAFEMFLGNSDQPEGEEQLLAQSEQYLQESEAKEREFETKLDELVEEYELEWEEN